MNDKIDYDCIQVCSWQVLESWKAEWSIIYRFRFQRRVPDLLSFILYILIYLTILLSLMLLCFSPASQTSIMWFRGGLGRGWFLELDSPILCLDLCWEIPCKERVDLKLMMNWFLVKRKDTLICIFEKSEVDGNWYLI